MPEKKAAYFVTMTDTFMSGWGRAEGKKNKLVFLCDTYEEAEIVKDNAENRTDQKHINITTTKPYYNSERYYVQYKTKEVYNSWYVKNFFRKQKYEREAL